MKLSDFLPRIETIYGRDGVHSTPYMKRFIWGSFRIHKFYRCDADPDCHDHMWDFHTFPLNKYGYYEEVLSTGRDASGQSHIYKQISYVPGWTWTFVPAGHIHRVLGGATKDHAKYEYPIWTIIWTGKPYKDWGFFKVHNDRKRIAFIPWKDYVYGDGASRIEHEWAVQDQAQQETAPRKRRTRKVADEEGAAPKPARQKRKTDAAGEPPRQKRKYTRRQKTGDQAV